MENVCLDCGTALKGRADKKFCDDQCRSNYNNRLKSEDNLYVNQVNRSLKRNRQILQKNNPTGKTRMSRQVLAEQGFNFNFHTHRYETRNGHTYIFCYEYGFLPLNDSEVLLVKWEERSKN